MTRGALLSVDGDDKDKDMKEVTQCLQDEKTFKDGVDGEGNSLLGDDRVKCNGVAEEVNVVGQGGTLESYSVQQHIPQLQPQGAIVCWERFLHIRSLKVLLVEYDDSTRLVVTALLRNCSYEVIEAANGLQAWKMLEDLTNHIDLILTEVAMPGLSGIGLLYKIMCHKTRKNIPVIMMSSHDSMGLVFKCLSKGAVDFLVKPIRKNELKNLWQHVWRRCHSSSGSGSESGTQTQKSVKSKSLEKSDNNSGSNDEDDDGSEGLNNGDGSDNGSGTQSSWTKQAVEVDSPEPTFQWDQIAECPDSTCAQVVHSNAEIFSNNAVPLAIKESTEQNEQLVKTAGSKHSQAQDVGPSKFNEKISRRLDLNCENQSSEPWCKGMSVSDAIPRTFDSQMPSGEFEALDRRPKYSDVENKSSNNDEELPSLELSLKRLRGVKDAGIAVQDERNVLRRSDLSAFSRYNAASNTKKSPTGYVGSNSPNNNSLEVTEKDLSRDIQSHSSGNPPNQNSNGASNNIDMGSTTDNNAFTKSAVIRGPTVASTTKCLYQSSAFQHLKNNLMCASQQVVLHDTEDKIGPTLAPPRVDIHKDSATKDFRHHFESHNCLANNMQHQLPPNHRAELFKKVVAAAPHFGSSNVVDVVVESNVGNCSVNRSASGSNNGSNGQNGCSTAFNVGGTNIENNNGLTGNSGSGDGSANRVDQNKISQREAALTKFREKRKERCFHKKVRYQSRKKLAEQRPRFRGQFVRQSSNGSASEATDS